ncbi:MAG: hypothetical protein Q9M36_08560 [Sulfurovum sp.]|nr:hypothetical protein [Sulfurovum sp.]
MRENLVHDLIIQNRDIQYGINSLLSISNNTNYIHEDTYINGITADFTLLEDNKIRAIIECKAGDINVTDYVRGIGQSLQYEYFHEERISPKGFEYHQNFNSILLFPSSVVRENNFNIGNFKYPLSTLLFEINDTNSIIRHIQQKELDKLKQASLSGLVTLSQYYFRDTRIYEAYILLRHLAYMSFKGVSRINRTQLENDFLRKIGTPNNKNWRNAFITLSSLGLITSQNIPSPFGITLAHITFEAFASKIMFSYMQPYVKELYEVFNHQNTIPINNQEIKDTIYQKYNNRDVLFLTESDGRYISSWLNILRDDFGCIEFQARNSNRTIIYNPLELNELSLQQYIKKHSKAYEYIEKYNTLLRSL